MVAKPRSPTQVCSLHFQSDMNYLWATLLTLSGPFVNQSRWEVLYRIVTIWIAIFRSKRISISVWWMEILQFLIANQSWRVDRIAKNAKNQQMRPISLVNKIQKKNMCKRFFTAKVCLFWSKSINWHPICGLNGQNIEPTEKKEWQQNW